MTRSDSGGPSPRNSPILRRRVAGRDGSLDYMITIILAVVLVWFVVLAMLLGAIHVATSAPTPRRSLTSVSDATAPKPQRGASAGGRRPQPSPAGGRSVVAAA